MEYWQSKTLRDLRYLTYDPPKWDKDALADPLRIEKQKYAIRIVRFFDKLKSTRSMVSLFEIIDWIEDIVPFKGYRWPGHSECLDNEPRRRAVRELKTAMLAHAFSRKLGRRYVPHIMQVSMEGCGRITRKDLSLIHNSEMYKDPEISYALLIDLWVPRDLCLKLFIKKKWLQPYLITDDAQPQKRDDNIIPFAARGTVRYALNHKNNVA